MSRIWHHYSTPAARYLLLKSLGYSFVALVVPNEVARVLNGSVTVWGWGEWLALFLVLTLTAEWLWSLWLDATPIRPEIPDAPLDEDTIKTLVSACLESEEAEEPRTKDVGEQTSQSMTAEWLWSLWFDATPIRPEIPDAPLDEDTINTLGSVCLESEEADKLAAEKAEEARTKDVGEQTAQSKWILDQARNTVCKWFDRLGVDDPITLEFPKNPLVLVPCGHSVEAGIISKLAKCPFCRADIQRSVHSFLVSSIIDGRNALLMEED